MLLVPGAAAEPPSQVVEQVTDPSVHLSTAQVREVESALAALEDEHGIRLHYVLVDDFDGMDGVAWADETYDLSGMGAGDALLAVAVEAGRYGIIDEDVVTAERARQIATEEVEPRLRDGDWAGAAVAAAHGYAVAEPVGARSPWAAVLGILGAMAAVAAGGAAAVSWRSRRRLARTVLAERERTSRRIGQLRERLEELGEDVRFVPTELHEEDTQWARGEHWQAEAMLDEAVTMLGRVPREARGRPPSHDAAMAWKRDHDGAARSLDQLDEHLTTSVAQLREARELVTDPAPLSALTGELKGQRGRREQLARMAPVTEPAAATFVRRRVVELFSRADATLDEADTALRSAREHVEARRGRGALAAVTSARRHLAHAVDALDRVADPQAELDQALADLRSGQRTLRSQVAEGAHELDQHDRYARELAPPGRGGRWADHSPAPLAEAVQAARELVDAEPADDPQTQLGQIEQAAAQLRTAVAPYQQARARLEERRRAQQRARERANEAETANPSSTSSWSRSSGTSRSSSSRSGSSRSRSSSSRSSSSRSRSSSGRNRSGGRF